MTKTYDPRLVTMSFGSHIVTGFADDSHITIEANGDGITKKVGCDGEVARALPTDRTHKVKCVLLQTSDSNSVFQAAYKRDLETGEGKAPLLIKDLKGGLLYSSEEAWITKDATRTRGKDTNNNEWEFDSGYDDLSE